MATYMPAMMAAIAGAVDETGPRFGQGGAASARGVFGRRGHERVRVLAPLDDAVHQKNATTAGMSSTTENRRAQIVEVSGWPGTPEL